MSSPGAQVEERQIINIKPWERYLVNSQYTLAVIIILLCSIILIIINSIPGRGSNMFKAQRLKIKTKTKTMKLLSL